MLSLRVPAFTPYDYAGTTSISQTMSPARLRKIGLIMTAVREFGVTRTSHEGLPL
jgi:hypothetical protein